MFGEVLQACLGIFDLLPLQDRCDQPNQRPVRPLPRQAIPEGINLHLPGIGQDAAAGREPEIGELPASALFHNGPVHRDGPARLRKRHLRPTRLAKNPPAPRQARFG